MSTFAVVLLASGLTGLVTTVGILVVYRYAAWASRRATYLIAFAAGILVAVSFMHLVPEAFEINPSAPIFLLGGFLGIHLANRFMNLYLGHDQSDERDVSSILAVVGIGFHSLIDGAIHTVTFNVSIFTGTLAAIGMILHEFPEGIMSFVLLERAGLDRRKAAIYAFLAAAASTPVGALISYPFIQDISQSTLGLLLALAAGALIYVGATHLLPDVARERKRYSVFAFLAGILVAVVIVFARE